ncbi:bifunctional ADP-dependent NAD(P)H-hydrate dehydratase/NAD(P)H-hydrate epimerase [Aeromicrobium sp. A1-2]|uniref:bifunctional ADP-dependent NAD(P)H-hydrate dehydratase/NAD(P)H-hydrate epimerase n=1 Tax=Aeromicrobium sp. A1-2 TaxID=2107713 RepID=UPI000E5464E4|nr:bifunctional ADP-dependent NAD(P)H-hydrate dehydratase/NAD(P)H-hydrate epimerase [Aeromicrobium sp. A1-2]AXT84036.1 bifunctional ADP-dependent NAD(P)H-hydrate dehydratase/NAD(P)H-hydrate epimerase [Aeromicrobium sp. A1-2]
MLTAHRVSDIRAAEDSLAATLPEGELMRLAARGLADHLGRIPPGDLVLVLIGPGNNGGDALFAAEHLLDRGVRVDVCLLDATTVHAPGLAAAAAAGAQVVDAPGSQRWCLDAMFGIGGRSGLSGRAAEWAAWLAEQRPFTISVDVPSGVDVDGATLPASYVTADLTVTFGTRKAALLVDPAAAAAGTVSLVDIGLAPHLRTPALEALEATDGHLLDQAVPGADSHKYSRGVLGIAAGSAQYAGAAHLCVAGAQAGPAGMIRFVGLPELGRRIVDRAPEVVTGRGRVQAWVVGPGSGDDAAAQLAMALEDGVPLVVDASALRHIPDRFDVPALLTPHAGELAQMLATTRAAVEADPLAHAMAAAERWNATVLLKGRRTLIAQTGAPTRVNLSGSSWLATAGAGDVLAGFAGSLLAAGLDPLDAGSVAAYLHGTAAVHANPDGPIVATDVAYELPATVAAFVRGDLA